MGAEITWKVWSGDALERLSEMQDESAQCIVTSPPYWGLRDYGVEGQVGLEPTREEFLQRIVEIFREARRVLRNDGTAWINLGDTYCAAAPGLRDPERWPAYSRGHINAMDKRQPGLKNKDLMGIPWRVAFALQDDGWYLRSDIIWSKPNPMPESVTDRPTKSHEYVFLLAKQERYFYDADAVRQPISDASIKRLLQTSFDTQEGGEKDGLMNANRSHRKALVNLKKKVPTGWAQSPGYHGQVPGIPARGKLAEGAPGQVAQSLNKKGHSGYFNADGTPSFNPAGVNLKTVWTIPTQATAEAHFATFPERLVDPCIRAGTRPGDTVLDPFCGSGTTGIVAIYHGRNFQGIELNPDYVEIARRRLAEVAPLFAEEAAA